MRGFRWVLLTCLSLMAAEAGFAKSLAEGYRELWGDVMKCMRADGGTSSFFIFDFDAMTASGWSDDQVMVTELGKYRMWVDRDGFFLVEDYHYRSTPWVMTISRSGNGTMVYRQSGSVSVGATGVCERASPAEADKAKSWPR